MMDYLKTFIYDKHTEQWHEVEETEPGKLVITTRLYPLGTCHKRTMLQKDTNGQNLTLHDVINMVNLI